MDKVVKTEDGSATLYSAAFEEHYHSTNGALQESRHVFIEAGLRAIHQKFGSCNLLEFGFGTGLNALLAYAYSEQNAYPIDYHSYEAFPISVEAAQQLGYPALLGHPEWEAHFFQMHQTPKGKLSENFQYTVLKQEFAAPLASDHYHLVFFDAFSPEQAPDCWEQWIFDLLYQSMRSGGSLLTYCAKGAVRRSMLSAGFKVEKLPGPPGKREILRANKH